MLFSILYSWVQDLLDIARVSLSGSGSEFIAFALLFQACICDDAASRQVYIRSETLDSTLTRPLQVSEEMPMLVGSTSKSLKCRRIDVLAEELRLIIIAMRDEDE